MKKIFALSALAVAVMSPLAQAQVNVNIDGEILALTCHTDTANTASEKTLTMRDTVITDFSNKEVDGAVSTDHDISFNCPASNNVKITMTDGGSNNTPGVTETVQTSGDYLSNTRPGTVTGKARATGVGVKLYVKVGSNAEQLLRIGQETNVRPKTAGGAAYANNETLRFTLHPKYYRIGDVGTVTPGIVRAKATLTFSHD